MESCNPIGESIGMVPRYLNLIQDDLNQIIKVHNWHELGGQPHGLEKIKLQEDWRHEKPMFKLDYKAIHFVLLFIISLYLGVHG
jgi:hypothetical protein